LTSLSFKRDPLQVTSQSSHDGFHHYAYGSALTALCGRKFPFGFGFGLGEEPEEADCPDCTKILRVFVDLKLERRPNLGLNGSCQGTTRKGTPCQRDVVYDEKWCPSHWPAARMEKAVAYG
jgi:hypothetical protein